MLPGRLLPTEGRQQLPAATDQLRPQGRVLDHPAPFAVYNIGNHTPVALPDYIRTLERALGKKAKMKMEPMQPGDVKATYADTRALRKAVGFAPSTPLQAGLERFAAWFKQYYGYR